MPQPRDVFLRLGRNVRVPSRIVERPPWLLPSHHTDFRSLANPGCDLKFVDQALGATQSQAESLARSKTVAQSELNIGNSRTLVGKSQAETGARPVQDHQFHAAPTAMNKS